MPATPCPTWLVPPDLAALIASDDDSTWEMPGWSPFRILAIAGTVYAERDVRLAWQLEFDPFDDAFAEGTAELFDPDDEPDGYSWADLLAAAVARKAPALAEELIVTDSEASDCVIWTASETACRLLAETAWSLLLGDSRP